MSFSFGTPKTTEGYTLGTPTNTPAASSGINYAAGDNKGLSTPQLGAKTQSFGLTMGTPGSTNTSGFQLGGTPANTSGFQLGGTPANTSGFQLGGTPANTSISGGFQLGGTPGQVNTTANMGLPLLGTPNKSFGLPAASTAIPVASAAPTNFSLGSTLNAQSSAPTLFSSLAKTTAPTLATPGTVASTPTFNLGSTLGGSGAPAASTGFTLGGVSSTGLTPATASTTFSLGATPATTTTSTGLSLTSTASTSLTSTTTTVTPAAPTGTFTFGQLEEALNKWTLELEDQGKMFINQALQLNAWDRLVIANGEKILTLNNGIEKVKQQQLQLDHELDFVLAQQRELEECITPLEKELKDIPITDQDRNHTYQIAENMDTQLKQMSEDLKEIIEHLNESNKTEETNDPVAQIGRILNAHMNSLQWIDRNTAQISTYLDQITKMHDMHRRDNERSFHLTYE